MLEFLDLTNIKRSDQIHKINMGENMRPLQLLCESFIDTLLTHDCQPCRVTDVGVRHIAHHCTKIKRLNLSGLYLLTGERVALLLRSRIACYGS